MNNIEYCPRSPGARGVFLLKIKKILYEFESKTLAINHKATIMKIEIILTEIS